MKTEWLTKRIHRSFRLWVPLFISFLANLDVQAKASSFSGHSSISKNSEKGIHSQTRPNKVLYFTFDDGPSKLYTPQILNILHQYHVKATFFVLGYRCKEFPGLIRRIRREGHELGSHGYDHRFLDQMSIEFVREEVMRTDKEIETACGVRPVLFRPPGGLMNRQGKDTILQLGHPIAMWTVDSKDWKALSSQNIIYNVTSVARPGAVILFHDGVTKSKLTIQALPVLIGWFRSRGYTFDVLPVQRTVSAVTNHALSTQYPTVR